MVVRVAVISVNVPFITLFGNFWWEFCVQRKGGNEEREGGWKTKKFLIELQRRVEQQEILQKIILFPGVMADFAARRTIDQLVNNFGFPRDRSEEAVRAISNKGDVQMACDWLLDHGEEDKGGAVTLVVCDHFDAAVEKKLAPIERLKYGERCVDCGNEGENWVCLFCAETRCSRYCQSHGVKHWEETKENEEAATPIASLVAGATPPLGHFLSLSLMDLSVWCYECKAYVTNHALKARVRFMEGLKFGKPIKKRKERAPEPSAPLVAGGSMQERDWTLMHGYLGKKEWSPPQVMVASNNLARPGYKSKSASEFLDTPEVLAEKIKVLAKMIKKSRNMIAYTGAGISTASGVPDYASNKQSSLVSEEVKQGNGLNALPTQAHIVLTHLHFAGWLNYWVQQNHDGLPQKAGYPQKYINEIHGAWFDPSNPVVPMTGTLRPDLVAEMSEWEEKVDLCLALGTTMCGMNADRVFVLPSEMGRRAHREGRWGGEGERLGGVIVNLQQTQYDHLAGMRIFAKIDDVMVGLARELGVPLEPLGPLPMSFLPETEVENVFTGLPYNKEGKKSPGSSLTLDLRPGRDVRLVRQPGWDEERKGNMGTVLGRTKEGNYVLDLRGVVRRSLGGWWIGAAMRGEVEYLPVVNI